MRLSSLVIPTVLVVAVGAAYAAGHFVGSRDADQRARQAIAAIDGQQGATALFVADQAIGNLERGKIADAHKVLVRYARLQVPRVRACSQSEFCKAFAGAHLQSANELEKVVTRDESLPATTQ